MSEVRIKGSPYRYWVLDSRCIGKDCFVPGTYQHRGATLSGSKSSGTSRICMTNAYRGCPDGREYSEELAKKRKVEGWKIKSACAGFRNPKKP